MGWLLGEIIKCIKDDFDALEHEQMKTGVWGCPCKSCQDSEDSKSIKEV